MRMYPKRKGLVMMIFCQDPQHQQEIKEPGAQMSYREVIGDL
jgi:hypothetical protein